MTGIIHNNNSTILAQLAWILQSNVSHSPSEWQEFSPRKTRKCTKDSLTLTENIKWISKFIQALATHQSPWDSYASLRMTKILPQRHSRCLRFSKATHVFAWWKYGGFDSAQPTVGQAFYLSFTWLCIGINLAIVSVLQALSKIIAYDLLLFNYAINLATIYDVLAIIQLLVLCYFAATHHLAKIISVL